MFKSNVFLCLFLLSAVVFCGEETIELYRNSLEQVSAWKSNDPAVSISCLPDAGKDGAGLCLDFRITDTTVGHAWPQAVLRIPAQAIDERTWIEFDCFLKPGRGEIKLRFLPKEQADVEEILFPELEAGTWNHLVFPLRAKKSGAVLQGIGFVVAKRAQHNGDQGRFLIDNIRIFKGRQHKNAATTKPADLPAGVFRQIFQPASERPRDQRLEIEIPNLLLNGYFREGAERIPPRGWAGLGMENAAYVEGLHDGRALRLAPSTFRYVACRQNGLVLIPGEKYRISGYIRGENFTGKGSVVVACDNWSNGRGLFFQEKMLKSGQWFYFETVFAPTPSKAREWEFIVHRTSDGGGFVDFDRLILEAVDPAVAKKSRNKYYGNKFEETYEKALLENRFRSGPPSDDYELVWSDEFTGEKVDTDRWKVYDLQDYRETRGYVFSPENLVPDGQGNLLMRATRAEDGIVHQARLSTTGHHTWVYGFFECRFKLHGCDDLVNAAFWMLPEGAMDAGNPVETGMEIDIMECPLPSRESLSHTTHWYSYDPETKKRRSFSGGTRPCHVPGLSKGFHTVALEWTPDAYVFYIDGIESLRLTADQHPITRKNQNLILSFQGSAAKIKEIPGFSAEFTIDYVRVYQKKR